MPNRQASTIEINLHVTRGWIVALIAIMALLILAVSFLTSEQQVSSAANPEMYQATTTGKPYYYLTKRAYNGSQALTACAAGYHMASMWEIVDPSNLQYNSTLGFVRDDRGLGPVTGAIGWVRTGFSNDTSNTPGRGNCNGWTSSAAGDYGTGAYLPYTDWTIGSDLGVWQVDTEQCNASWWSVWCVED